MKIARIVLLIVMSFMISRYSEVEEITTPDRAERIAAFRSRILNDNTALEKLHKLKIDLAYLASLKWKIYPNECKEIILISSSHQRLVKFVDGLPKDIYICSTKAKRFGCEHFGFFSVMSHEINHFSKLYHVNMPYALHFDGDIFIHATKKVRQLGRRASHGCIRLAKNNARKLYYSSKNGAPIAYLP